MRNFDRNFNLVQYFVYGWIIFAVTLLVVIYATIGYIGYNVATDPGVIGRAAGEIVKQYNDTVKK